MHDKASEEWLQREKQLHRDGPPSDEVPIMNRNWTDKKDLPEDAAGEFHVTDETFRHWAHDQTHFHKNDPVIMARWCKMLTCWLHSPETSNWEKYVWCRQTLMRELISSTHLHYCDHTCAHTH